MYKRIMKNRRIPEWEYREYLIPAARRHFKQIEVFLINTN